MLSLVSQLYSCETGPLLLRVAYDTGFLAPPSRQHLRQVCKLICWEPDYHLIGVKFQPQKTDYCSWALKLLWLHWRASVCAGVLHDLEIGAALWGLPLAGSQKIIQVVKHISAPRCSIIHCRQSASAENIRGADHSPNGSALSTKTSPCHSIPSSRQSCGWTGMF